MNILQKRVGSSILPKHYTGKITEIDNNGYGKIVLNQTSKIVFFRVSQIKAPQGYKLNPLNKIGRKLLNTNVTITTRSISGTLIARTVEVASKSRKVQKLD